VFVADGHDAQKEEDDAVGEGAHGLDGVLDGGVTLLGDVGEGISFLCNSTSNLEKQFKVILICLRLESPYLSKVTLSLLTIFLKQW